ncbi:MAG: hypothetical protein ACI9MR_001314 [Myxococcota bacterium]
MTTESRDTLHGALRVFLHAPNASLFDALAARVVAYQAEKLAVYGRLCASRGGVPQRWQDAPLVPTELFRDIDLCSQPHTERVFRTSGTTGQAPGTRGYRRVPDTRLYDAAMTPPFVAHVLAGDPVRRPWLSLIPPASDLPESSLSHMTSALAAQLATEVTWAMRSGGLDLDAARAFLARHDGPVVIMTTSFALVHWLDANPETIPLAPGSRMMTTGGFKGKSRTVTEAELLDGVLRVHGLGMDSVIPEYGMTELSSQAYGRPLVANPSLRLRVVDPLAHTDVEPGETGLVACFDLLNLDNVSAVLTSDLGRLDANGRLTLLGRAPDAIARGCSLTAEAILAQSQETP